MKIGRINGFIKEELMFNILLLGGSLTVSTVFKLLNIVEDIRKNTLIVCIIILFVTSVVLRYSYLSLNYIYTRICVNKKKIRN